MMRARSDFEKLKYTSKAERARLPFEYDAKREYDVGLGSKKTEEKASFKVLHYAAPVWYQV